MFVTIIGNLCKILNKMNYYHKPVMPTESIEYLNVTPGFWYIDCNLGGGGHTSKILEKGGKVIGIDLDNDAIREVAKKYNLEVVNSKRGLRAFSDNLILAQSNFANIDQVAYELDIKEIAGIFFDLGVSSFQLETAQRGFSFNLDAPLDMRMDQSFGATAADLVNGLHEKELAELFWKYGEENFSKVIAKKIVEVRKSKRIETTNQLANIISSVRRKSPVDRTHPATRVFQALRIAVNDEINSLKEALPKASNLLSIKGRLVVISFHSLEDRVVKNYFKKLEDEQKAKILTGKPIEPSEEEVNINPRSRSGKLRAIEKVS